MICPVCQGSRWIRKEVMVPAHIYGEPRKTTVAVPCNYCSPEKVVHFDGTTPRRKRHRHD